MFAGIKRLQNPQAQQDRFRILVSDGEYSHSCMLATQLANLVHSGELVEGSIFELTDYICNSVQNKKWVARLNKAEQGREGEAMRISDRLGKACEHCMSVCVLGRGLHSSRAGNATP